MQLTEQERKVLELIDGEAVDGFSEYASEELKLTFEEVEVMVEKLIDTELVFTGTDDEDDTDEGLYYWVTDLEDESEK